MLPVLEAQESLLAFRRGAMAAGSFPADVQRAMLDDWRWTASRGQASFGLAPVTPVQLSTHLAGAAGIAVRKVPVKTAAAPPASGA